MAYSQIVITVHQEEIVMIDDFQIQDSAVLFFLFLGEISSMSLL